MKPRKKKANNLSSSEDQNWESTCWKTGTTYQHLHAERQEPPSIGMLKRHDPLACEIGWSLRVLFKPMPSTVSKHKVQILKHHQYLQAFLTAQDLYLHTHTKKTYWVWLMTGNVQATFKLQDWNSSLWLHPPQGFLSYYLNGSVLPSTTASMKNRVWLCLTSLLFS